MMSESNLREKYKRSHQATGIENCFQKHQN